MELEYEIGDGCNTVWYTYIYNINTYIKVLVQDCGISIANALEVLQCYNKPLIYCIQSNNEYRT